MPGNPQLSCPVPVGFVWGVDIAEIASSNLFPAAGSSFEVSAKVRMAGTIATFLQGAGNGQDFTVTIYGESFGGGPEGALGSQTENTETSAFAASAACAGASEYPVAVTVTAPAAAETYKLTAVLTSGFPMNAYDEGPLINVT